MKKAVTYLERISESSESKDKKNLTFKARDAKVKAQIDLLETEKRIAEMEETLENVKSRYPYSIVDEVELVANLESLKQGLKRGKQIFDERFKDISDI